ncbi:MAG: DUF3500 domain-containing protein [Planctomycetales bacterium]|nr:DUF3500 domain-containing protein [Planctomycetales bacterium]
MRSARKSLLRCSLMVLVLASVAMRARAHDPAEEMAEAASRLLQSLNEQQREQAVYTFTDDQRQNWHYLPDSFIKPDGTRYGLPLEQMTAAQQALAYGLVSSGLSHRGYLTAMTITSLEEVLHELENGNPIRRPELYYVTVFGTPGDAQTWGWRFEGHHLSVNVTIVDGKLFSVTPSFFGSNPAVVPQGPRAGLRTLADEELLARALVKSLSPEQQKTAVIEVDAPDDIITSESRNVDRGAFTPPRGVASSDLNDEQCKALLALIRAYAERFRPEIVVQIDQRTQLFDLGDVYFAWAGGLEPGDRHYYRVQTPVFLIEYDNTQNDANHVHAVWRDFDGDFGEDLLRRHYEQDHDK